MANFSIVAELIANTKQFMAGMTDAKGAVEQLQKSTGNKFQRIGDTVSGVGKALTVGLTAPLAAVGGASLKAYADFDEALIGVAKTTEYSGDKLTNFGKEIWKMTRTMPVSATELAGLAQTAAQLGISADDNGVHLLEFSKIAAQMGTATNMSSEQAAEAMSRIANITQMPQQNFKNLGSTIVALGNKMATTESEITEMGLRLAGTGSQVGLSEHQIMALAASMASVGINAEAGGSSMSRVMQKINTEVLSSGEKLEGFAQVAGYTASDFADLWKREPQEAITAFVNGLGKVKDSGGDVTSTLKNLGIQSVQEIDTLGRLAGSGELLGDAFEIANGAWEEGIALQNEFDSASGSFKNQLVLLKNALDEAGNVIGERLAPKVKEVADFIKDLTEKFNNLPPGVQDTVINFGLFLVALGPVLWVVGKVIKVIGFFKDHLGLLKGALGLVKGAFGLLGKAIGFLVTNPMVGMIAIIVGLIAYFAYLWMTNEEFREKVIEIWEKIKTKAFEIWDKVKEYFSELWETIRTKAGEAWDSFKEYLTTKWEAIKTAFSETWQSIKDKASEIWEGIKTNTETIWNIVKDYLSNVWETVKTKISESVENLKSKISEGWENMKSTVSTKMSDIKENISQKWEEAKSTVSNKVNEIKTNVTNAWENIKSSITNKMSEIKTNIQTGWNNVVSTVQNAGPRIVSAVRTAFSNAVSAARTFVGEAISAGANLISGFVQGVTNAAGRLVSAVTGAVGNAIRAAKNLLGIHSPSRVFRKFGQFTDEGFVIGIKKGAGQVVKAMSGMAGGAIDAFLGEDVGGQIKAGLGAVGQLMAGGFEVPVGLDMSGMSVLDNLNNMLSASLQNDLAMEIGHNSQPIHLNLALGREDYNLFVDDIFNQHSRQERYRLRSSSI